MISFDPNSISTQERYKIATGSVIPRPIALVSTMSEDGKSNLAPFSFFTIAAYNPLVLVFFPMNYKTGEELKDTAINFLETKECVIHIATEELAEKINQTSGLYPYGENEFDKANLTPVPSHVVKPFRVKECPIHFECILYKSVSIGEGVGGSTALFAEVVKAHFNENLIYDYKIDAKKLAPVTRLAGLQWGKLGELFELKRPIV